MPVDGGNRQLALDRAKQVLKAVEESGRLVGKIDMAKVERRAVSNGARDPLKECSSRETLDYQRECNAPNRRVELRLRFTAIELPKGVRR
jgi:outer membrane protein OmpA-like peptidoglycan-associated protein